MLLHHFTLLSMNFASIHSNDKGDLATWTAFYTKPFISDPVWMYPRTNTAEGQVKKYLKYFKNNFSIKTFNDEWKCEILPPS